MKTVFTYNKIQSVNNYSTHNYEHPTIKVYPVWFYNGKEHITHDCICTIIAQCNKEGKINKPYAERIELNINSYTNKEHKRLINKLLSCDNFFDVLKVLFNEKCKRFVYHDYDYIPYQFRNKPDLYKVMQENRTLAKVINS